MSSPSSAIAPVAARARRQLGEAVERAQQRRLAAARRADQREHLALVDRERRRRLTAALAAVEDADARRAHALGPAAARGTRARRGRRRSAPPPSAASRPRSRPAAAASADRRSRRHRRGECASRLASSSVSRSCAQPRRLESGLRPRGDRVDREVQRRGRSAAARRRRRRPSAGRCPRPPASCCRRSSSASSRCPRSSPSSRDVPSGSMRSVAPSSRTTIAVSPTMRPMPSAAPVAMSGRDRRAAGRGGSSRSASCPARRRPRARGAGSPAAPSRVAPKTIGSAISDIIDPGGRGTSGRRRRRPRRVNDRGAKMPAGRAPGRRSRCTMSGVPAIDLDARLDGARQPRGPPVLDDPDRGARRRSAWRSAIPITVSRSVPSDRVEEAAGVRLVDRALRARDEQLGLQVLRGP